MRVVALTPLVFATILAGISFAQPPFALPPHTYPPRPAAPQPAIPAQVSVLSGPPPRSVPVPLSPERLPRVLQLDDVESLALQYSPALARSGAEIEMARGRAIQAGLYPNPRVAYHGMEIGSEDTAGQQGAFVSQQFVTGGKLRLSQQAAAEEVRVATWRYEMARLRTLTDVRILFYEVLTAQRRVLVTRDLASIAAKSAEAAQRLLDNDQGTENSVLLAQNERSMAELDRARATDLHAEAWRRLTAAAGLPHLRPTEVAGNPSANLPRLEWDQALAQILASSPQIAAAAADIERARAQLRRAGVEWIPNVDLTVAARHDNASGDDVADVVLEFPLPLFNRNQGNVQAAQAELTRAEAELSRIELGLQDRLATAFRRYTIAQRTVALYDAEILPRARKSLDLVTNGYDRGQVDYLTLLTSQKAYFQLQLAYLDILQELRASGVTIEGNLLMGSLQGE